MFIILHKKQWLNPAYKEFGFTNEQIELAYNGDGFLGEVMLYGYTVKCFVNQPIPVFSGDK